MPGRLLKKAAAVSWNVPFSKGTFNLIESEERKPLHAKKIYEDHCMA